MSKWDKLINRLYHLDTSLRYAEVEKILWAHGYRSYETSGGSSHITFRKEGCNPVTIPRHNPIKKVYLEIVKNIVVEANKE